MRAGSSEYLETLSVWLFCHNREGLNRGICIILNARLVLQNFDIFATAGGQNKAVVEQFVVPADNTGTITLQFLTVKNNAQINAIEVMAV